MASRRTRRPVLALGALVAVLLPLSACGGSSDGGSGDNAGGGTTSAPTAKADSSLASLVPADVAKDGKIVIGVDATYAPAEFLDKDGKTVKGFDIDLFNAVAGKLGLKTQWVPAPFGSIITGVKSGKYEIGVSSFTISEERKKEADMVSYFTVGTAWATAKGNPDKISADDACGKRVAVQKDTVQVPDIQARDKKCKTDGKSGITIDQYQGQDQATAAVVSGKDQAMLSDYPVVVYAVQQTGGKLELLGEQYEAAPYGYVIPKGEKGLSDALIGALKATIADGTYKKILTQWGVEQGAIDTPQLNP